ncbi:MAG: YveK family protein [Thiobacillus sp.]
MDLIEMLSTIWRTKWIILITAVVAGGLVMFNSLRQDATYTANATLVVGSMSPGSSRLGQTGGEDKLALSYADLIRTRVVLDQAVKNGGLNISSDQLSADIGSVPPPKDAISPYVNLYATTRDPQSAINEVNATAKSLVDYLAGMQSKALQDDQNEIVNQLTQVEAEIAQIQASPTKDPARKAGL